MAKDKMDPISHRLNTTNAKLLAIVLITGFVVYHGVLHLSYKIDSCKWLLSEGRYQGVHFWQPYGCMYHNYTKFDTRTCLRYIAYWGGRNYIVFMGDSRVRQLYRGLIKLYTAVEPEGLDIAHHKDLQYTDESSNLNIQFIWCPMMNASMSQKYNKWLSLPEPKRPNLIVTGVGTWSIKESNGSLQVIDAYRDNLTRISSSMKDMGDQGTHIIWMLQDQVNEEKLAPERKMITNEQIDLYNKAAMGVLNSLTGNKLHVWGSARLLTQGFDKDQADGLHMGDLALTYATQILMNVYCNDHMNFNDGTCCADPEAVTGIQIITLSFFGVMIVLSVGILIHRQIAGKRYRAFTLLVPTVDEIPMRDMNLQRDSPSPTSSTTDDFAPLTSPVQNAIPKENPRSTAELIFCFARFGCIMYFAFVSDRTNFFMKENKYYTHPNFFLPLCYVFTLGLFFTDTSSHTRVMHRDQTDEWKGWMQLVILTYHMTGASQVLPIYVHIRLLVTTYLFLTGFGHFTYFWTKGDQGLSRFWDIVFRNNVLVVFLCLTMNRPYQFYYFVPLVTFWYLVIHLTLTTFPQVTSQSVDNNPVHYLYMVFKFIILFSIVTVLYMSEVFFEKIFLTRPWKALFVTTDDSIKEWWFRWKIDRYAVPSGMVFSFVLQVLKKHHFLDDSTSSNLFNQGVTVASTLVSLVGIASYTGFSLLCRNKPECNEIHPYISFIPIVSFIAIRNSCGYIRTKYSAFFAWFGRISLELFILQYHIWLAANTHGVLVLIPSYPVLNFLVTIFIFVFASHEIHSTTRKLSRYFVSDDWRYMLRNLVVFFLILIPIGVKDGMF